MKLPRRRDFPHLAVGAATLPASSTVALAQNYPTRPITVVVPFAAGGPVDTLARMLTGRMRQFLGQPVVVEDVAVRAAALVSAGSPARRLTAIR